MLSHIAVLSLLLFLNVTIGQIPYYPEQPPYPNWVQLEPPDGIKFVARNGKHYRSFAR
jgi:hypothetical protein